MIVTTIAAVLVGFVIGTHYNNKERFNMEKNKNIKARIVGRTRRGRIVRMVSAFLLIPAVAVAALLLFRADITGSITPKAAPNLLWTSTAAAYDGGSNPPTYNPKVTGDGSGITGTATIANGGEALNLTIKDGYAGTTATVKSYIETTSTDMVFAGINLGGTADVEVIKGATNWEPGSGDTRLTIGCGDPLTAKAAPAAIWPPAVSKHNNPIAFRVTMPDVGGTIPAEAGLIAMPLSEWNAMSDTDKAANGCLTP